MTPITCGECGINYSMPDAKYNDLKKTGDTFYCPNGHARHFIVGPDEKDQQIARLRQTMHRDMDRFSELLDRLRELKERHAHCIICGYKVARVNAAPLTMEIRMREHLVTEHGARKSLRALPAKTGTDG